MTMLCNGYDYFKLAVPQELAVPNSFLDSIWVIFLEPIIEQTKI